MSSTTQQLPASNFEALLTALEGWFERPLAELPAQLAERVRTDFLPMPWDSLSAEGRRNIAQQWDDQHDPATEADRQYWWDFYERMRAVKAKIAEWEGVATPTAGDLATKERRLAELRAELGRMQAQESAGTAHELALRSRSADKSSGEGAVNRFIAFPRALKALGGRLGASPDELAAWVFLGPEHGGLAAYLNANELEPPDHFHYSYHGPGQGFDYLAPLMACWFDANEIAKFSPADRFITGKALIERWSRHAGLDPEAFIAAKIAESRLLDLHPTYGGTRGPEFDNDSLPPLAAGLFVRSQIDAIEAEDFGHDQSEPAATEGGGAVETGEGSGEIESGGFGEGQVELAQRHPDDQEVPVAGPQEVEAEVPQGHKARPAQSDSDNPKAPVVGSVEWRIQNARKAADARHSKPGGSRDKVRRIREIWATGKYDSRDRCAEEECRALDMSYKVARRALQNAPDPRRV